MGKILGLDVTHNLIIIGAGNLGQALAGYVQFEKRGFKIISLFDTNEDVINKTVRGVKIRPIEELDDYVKSNKVDIAAFTMPREKAPAMAKKIISLGIKAIWNFANMELSVPDDVVIENVHLSDSLMQLSYNIVKDKN